MKITEYILTDSSLKPIYKTFDLLDLAREIMQLNKEIQYINTNKTYENRKKFNYRLLIEEHEIKDLEKSDK